MVPHAEQLVHGAGLGPLVVLVGLRLQADLDRRIQGLQPEDRLERTADVCEVPVGPCRRTVSEKKEKKKSTM